MESAVLLPVVIVLAVVTALLLVVVGVCWWVAAHSNREKPGGLRVATMEAFHLKPVEDNRPMRPQPSRGAVRVHPRPVGAKAARVASIIDPETARDQRHPWEIDPRKVKWQYRIGKGNFGEVWLATLDGSPVAAKIMLPKLQTKTKLVNRFLAEILLMASLNNPNVVRFMGACIRPPNYMLLLEYCEHGSLHHFLRSEHVHGIPITLSLVLRFALDIARGVSYLHQKQSIVQRDLKARNILVDRSLNAKVADFGLSRVIRDEDASLTACGTPAWTAPEIVRMEAYTEKVDVYSFGIILWELITRQEPYGGKKGIQIAYAAAEKGMRPKVPSYCPEDYAALMKACWDDDPNKRPPFRVILKRLFFMKKEADAELSAAPVVREALQRAIAVNTDNQDAMVVAGGRKGATSATPTPTTTTATMGREAVDGEEEDTGAGAGIGRSTRGREMQSDSEEESGIGDAPILLSRGAGGEMPHATKVASATGSKSLEVRDKTPYSPDEKHGDIEEQQEEEEEEEEPESLKVVPKLLPTTSNDSRRANPARLAAAGFSPAAVAIAARPSVRGPEGQAWNGSIGGSDEKYKEADDDDDDDESPDIAVRVVQAAPRAAFPTREIESQN